MVWPREINACAGGAFSSMKHTLMCAHKISSQVLKFNYCNTCRKYIVMPKLEHRDMQT